VGYTNTFITVRQAAEMLGLSPKTLYAGKAGTEKLRRIRNGKRAVRMVRQEVEAHLQRLMSPDKLMTEITIEKASEQ
jgi:predicted DNA-binding transcriptional regulator AlpA